MKGTLQEALDSAREALGCPFDEESTKGNGKDHYKAIATWKSIPTTISTNVGIGKDIKLNGNTPDDWIDMTDVETVSIGEERVDIVEYGREYDPASHVIDAWAGVIEHFDDNDRPTNGFTIVKDCNTCLADNCDSYNLE